MTPQDHPSERGRTGSQDNPIPVTKAKNDQAYRDECAALMSDWDQIKADVLAGKTGKEREQTLANIKAAEMQV